MKQKYILFFTALLGMCYFIQAQNIYTYAGTGNLATSGDGGQAVNADIYRPTAVYMDAGGNLFITCLDNSVRMVNPSGIINTTVCCSGGDGNPANSAGLSFPYGVTFDAFGNMFIADANNNKIRKVNTSSIISTSVGVGGPCYFGGDGAAAVSASLCSPFDVSFDPVGNMYIADGANYCIRKVNTSGIITTIAGIGGSPGFSGDGGLATSAQLNYPKSAKCDAFGNIFIADGTNNRIRKIAPTGTITTIAGTGVGGHSGDGGLATAAQLNAPEDLVLDASGNIFISERNYIRKINTSGIISTIAGSSITGGYSGDGGPAVLAQFDRPFGLCLDASGNIYVADFWNNRIRVICMSACPLGVKENYLARSIKVFPNPTSEKIMVQSENNFEILSCTLLDVTGKEIAFSPKKKNELDVGALSEGLYFLNIQTSEGALTKKIVIQR